MVEEYDLRHLKMVICGAAPLSIELMKDFEKRFPDCGFRHAYGSTEAGIVTGNAEDMCQYKYARSCGLLYPNTLAKVIDASGKELGPNESGEVLFRGPQRSMGYLDNEAANMESFDSDGWYHSGDLGHFDADGFFYITERIKELIKVKGHQVPPAELEDCLLGHPSVEDCAVIGMPNEYAGELPKAYVVLADKSRTASEEDAKASAVALFAHVQQRKAKFKWLAEIEFVDLIPKSPPGKKLRKILRAADSAARSAPTFNGHGPNKATTAGRRFESEYWKTG